MSVYMYEVASKLHIRVHQIMGNGVKNKITLKSNVQPMSPFEIQTRVE